jgi:tRNA threonylcarbamoyladenosine biosynthesis protein TsaB
MIILTMRTDNPEAEVGLYEGETQLAYQKWLAHRELSQTLHHKIEAMLADHGKEWKDISGIVAYEGPGSFTGLRIGLTVANALSYGIQIPIVAARGDNWILHGIHRLQAGEQDEIALPFYGKDANITVPRK